MAQRWYVFQTHHGREFLATDHLNRQRYETLMPYTYVNRMRSGVVVKRERVAILRTYGFVRFDVDTDRWKPICSTIGVKRLLGNTPDRPTPLPPGVIESLQQTLLNSETLQSATDINPNCVVEVTRGMWRDHTGICQSVLEDVATVTMVILGELVNIAFALSDLRLISNGEGT
jgi:transcription antitermination factor NusG